MSASHPDTQVLRPYYDHDTFNAGYSVIFKKGVGIIDPKTNRPVTSNISEKLINQSIDENQGIIEICSNTGDQWGSMLLAIRIMFMI